MAIDPRSLLGRIGPGRPLFPSLVTGHGVWPSQCASTGRGGASLETLLDRFVVEARGPVARGPNREKVIGALTAVGMQQLVVEAQTFALCERFRTALSEMHSALACASDAVSAAVSVVFPGVIYSPSQYAKIVSGSQRPSLVRWAQLYDALRALQQDRTLEGLDRQWVQRARFQMSRLPAVAHAWLYAQRLRKGLVATDVGRVAGIDRSQIVDNETSEKDIPLTSWVRTLCAIHALPSALPPCAVSHDSFRMRRLMRGLLQAQVAQAVGINDSHLAAIELGKAEVGPTLRRRLERYFESLPVVHPNPDELRTFLRAVLGMPLFGQLENPPAVCVAEIDPDARRATLIVAAEAPIRLDVDLREPVRTRLRVANTRPLREQELRVLIEEHAERMQRVLGLALHQARLRLGIGVDRIATLLASGALGVILSPQMILRAEEGQSGVTASTWAAIAFLLRAIENDSEHRILDPAVVTTGVHIIENLSSLLGGWLMHRRWQRGLVIADLAEFLGFAISTGVNYEHRLFDRPWDRWCRINAALSILPSPLPVAARHPAHIRISRLVREVPTQEVASRLGMGVRRLEAIEQGRVTVDEDALAKIDDALAPFAVRRPSWDVVSTQVQLLLGPTLFAWVKEPLAIWPNDVLSGMSIALGGGADAAALGASEDDASEFVPASPALLRSQVHAESHALARQLIEMLGADGLHAVLAESRHRQTLVWWTAYLRRLKGVSVRALNEASGVAINKICAYDHDLPATAFEEWLRMARALAMMPSEAPAGTTHPGSLRMQRLVRDISGDVMAVGCGITRRYYYHIEAGQKPATAALREKITAELQRHSQCIPPVQEIRAALVAMFGESVVMQLEQTTVMSRDG